ncbi:hypothetical protein Pfo_008022, partial [Paulownia fortunei]
MDFKGGTEAQRYVWGGAIALQIHLHDSEVTTLPTPPAALVYLHLLVPQIKPFFSSLLPPGVDTVWFEYKGLPLKWYIPTGVLFDLLCAEPERPWNLTRISRKCIDPCEGEDRVNWSFINNIMNMSQSDQAELWHSVLDGQLEVYLCVSSKLKLDIVGDDFSLRLNSSTPRSRQSINDSVATATSRTVGGRTGRTLIRARVCGVWNSNGEVDGFDLNWGNFVGTQ